VSGGHAYAGLAAILGLDFVSWVGIAAAVSFSLIVVRVIRRRRRAARAEAATAAKLGLAPAPSAFAALMKGLEKTRARLGQALRRALGRELGQEAIDELEQAMLEADMGVAATQALLDDLNRAYRSKEARTTDELLKLLQRDLVRELSAKGNTLAKAASGPTVILVVGVNGVGKTTSIAKLTRLLREQGAKVLLCAGDTFRAAAVEQLGIWAERVGAPIVKGATGADPASVVHDAVEAALARGVDYLIVDTAGRLHTAKNLMSELGKIKRVIQKKIPEGPHEVLMVLDATLGQNAIQQAKTFQEVTDVSGLFLAKLDGTAKGGVVIAIHRELGIPVKFVGLGEKPEDIQPFDADKFVEALLA
jgi:fused signal recognition particle receptor